ncbi:MAG: ABC transporter permease, partial [Bacteroidota bacterium]
MLKHKSYSFLNLAGLSIGLAVCLLLSLWVKDELSYDRFHENSDRIYRSLWDAQYGDNSWRIPDVPVPLASMMEEEFPEVEVATQAFKGGFTLKKGQEFVREQNVLFVDEKFFDVFTVKALAGVP